MDFCTQLLQYDQPKRPSALEALRHPFVCAATPENHPSGAEDTAELFEHELRAAHGNKVGFTGDSSSSGNNSNLTGTSTPKGKAAGGGGGSATGRFASGGKKDPPQRLKSTKGKVVAKPEKPRANNATKQSRAKPGAAI